MSEKQGTHFWTMAIHAPGGQLTGGYGTWTPGRGQTRYDVFKDIRADLNEQHPESRDGVVIAFDIQPNKF